MINKIKLFTSKLTAVGIVVIALGILVLLNYIVSFFPIRTDLTENKIYSLSDSTKTILQELDDIVTIKLFFSEDLPNRLLPTKQEIESILDEYERIGKGNIKVETTDPADDIKAQQEAATLGVPQLQFSGIEKDKLEVSQGFFGGVVSFAGKSEPIGFFEEGANFEYLFTSAINKLTRKEIPKVAFARGHQETEQGLEIATQLLSGNYKTTFEYIKEGSQAQEEIGEEIKTLLIIRPKQEWSSKDKEILERFINKGGGVLFALDGVEVNNNLQAGKAQHNLFDFLENYGLKLNRDLIVSAANEIANFRTAQNIFITPYPFWVKIQPEGFNKDIIELSQLETAVFPWVSSIDVSKKAGIATYEFVKTVQQSYAQEDNFNLQPTQDFKLNIETGEKTVVAGAQVNNDSKGRIVLVGDAGFIDDSLLQRSQANSALFLNLVDWLSSEGKLAGIRARGTSYRPLLQVNDSMKNIVKYSNILIIPILLGMFGSIHLLRRR